MPSIYATNSLDGGSHMLSYTEAGRTARVHRGVIILRGRHSRPAAWPWTTSPSSTSSTLEMMPLNG